MAGKTLRAFVALVFGVWFVTAQANGGGKQVWSFKINFSRWSRLAWRTRPRRLWVSNVNIRSAINVVMSCSSLRYIKLYRSGISNIVDTYTCWKFALSLNLMGSSFSPLSDKRTTGSSCLLYCRPPCGTSAPYTIIRQSFFPAPSR